MHYDSINLVIKKWEPENKNPITTIPENVIWSCSS